MHRNQLYLATFGLMFGVLLVAGLVPHEQTIEQIQAQNIDTLTDAFQFGWQEFCDAPVDEGIMSLFPGINPSDATVHVMTINNRSIELPIKALSQLSDFDIVPTRKTLVYVNGFHTTDSLYTVQAHLELLQRTRRDLNVIVLDFAKSIQQLYYTVRHHVAIHAYFVYQLLRVLAANGIAVQDITLAGHSVGANIAALAAQLYKESGKEFIGQLVAIDPATMCNPAHVVVNATVAQRVIVLHGEGDVFGVRAPLGHIDIYPNGIGYYPRRRLQPGCDSKVCSHMYPFVLIMEALIEGVMIPAAKCDSWNKFRQQNCDYANTIAIGLNYPNGAANGIYFCLTQPNPPFTYMEHGILYKKDRRIHA